MSNQPMKFSATHSRNAHDWNYQVGENGRHMFIANGGVRKRCGLIITALGRFPGMSKKDAAEYLNANFHGSYTGADMSAVFKQLVTHGIAKNNGGIYSLTPKGKNLWAKIEKVWLGAK